MLLSIEVVSGKKVEVTRLQKNIEYICSVILHCNHGILLNKVKAYSTKWNYT